MDEVILSLGGNLGDRLKNLHSARDSILKECAFDEKITCAPIYKTTPVDCAPGTPDFYNTVLSFSYEHSPVTLLDYCLRLEKKLGRIRPNNLINAPRPIDIDIITFGKKIIQTTTLTVPHPRMLQRRFVLQPLAYILPNFTLPNTQNTVCEHLADLNSSEPHLTLVQTHW